ncbi:MAG TPA: PLP-dependent aminotransferase family protein [Candidatus Binataceae bacterium]|nr:PLP-dependent aminotransferase family protein [Candidatus Binataceae bacterium]
MAKQTAQFNLSAVRLDRSADRALADQLYFGIARAILDGRLRPGSRLPSTRHLAAEFRIARITASVAFDRLAAEGYVESRVGSGTRVSSSLPDDFRLAKHIEPASRLRLSSTAGFSRRGKLLARTTTSVAPTGGPPMALRHSMPAFDLFPAGLWRRMVADKISASSTRLMGYGDPAGYRPLREAIADYLGEVRAVRATTEQVIVVSGSQQALDLAARMLFDPGARVIVEDPGYRGACAAMVASGAQLYPIGIDEHGIRIDDAPAARGAYVTPSHQFPLGATMSVARRMALLKWANRWRAWIFEDDYDSEYRYVGRPLPALQGLDTAGRVIYIGTFSKVMFPALRLGFMVAPEHLAAGFAAAIALTDRHAPTIEQAALADFIREGHFARHVRRMRIAYGERRRALIDAAQRHLKGLVDVDPGESGMHCVGWLPDGTNDIEVSRRAADAGIGVTPLSSYYMTKPARSALILGFAATPPLQIEDSVRRLATIARSTIKERRSD